MNTVSKALAPDLFLVAQDIPTTDSPTTMAVHHIIVVDCSASMAGDLPELRRQLKSEIVKFMGPDDTITLIWFSGRGEFGTLIAVEQLNNPRHLMAAQKTIDRWLRPVGMTGFQEPLQAVAKVLEGLVAPAALIFMTDGQENQWPREQVLEAARALKGKLAAATFVEYGLYADRAMLAAMAQATGGQHLVARDLAGYRQILECEIARRAPSMQKTVKLAGVPRDNTAFAIVGGKITTFDLDTTPSGLTSKSATVSNDVTTLYYLTSTRPAGVVELLRHEPLLVGAYAALAVYGLRAQPKIIYPLLRFTGDVYLIDMFEGCFGRQRYNAFVEAARAAAFDPENKALLRGYDPGRVPSQPVTIFHVLETLIRDKARICVDHPAFKYSRISRKRLDADEVLTLEEAAELEEIRDKLTGERDAEKIKALQEQIDQLISSKRQALKFAPHPAPDGYEIEGLVFHSDQPNLSVRVKRTGYVDLSSRVASMPAELQKAFAERDCWAIPAFETFIWRNYAIVANGLINVDYLPVKMSPNARASLWTMGVEIEEAEGGIDIIDLRAIAIINRGQVEQASLREAAGLEYELTRLRAFQKVFSHTIAARGPGNKAEGLAEQYGDAAANWLVEQGITDHGFAPKSTTAAPVSDVITVRSLAIKLAGYSTLPPVKDVIASVVGGKKLNKPEALMSEALLEIETKLAAQPTSEAADAWLEARQREIKRAMLSKSRELAILKWAITVGQAWFVEFQTLDENTLEIDSPQGKIKVKAELREVEVKI